MDLYKILVIIGYIFNEKRLKNIGVSHADKKKIMNSKKSSRG